MRDVKPKRIRLEASSVCQLKCVLCSQSTGDIENSIIGKGFLKFFDFKKLIDDNPWIERIELSNFGEIFLNPEILDIIRYGYERNLKLTANNGVNLNNVTEEVLEGLVKYRFHSMTCSIDGCSNDTYSKYRIHGNYDAVINNIKIINRYKEKYNSEYPLMRWQFIIFGHNEHEILEAKKKAKELNMKFNLKLNYNPEYSPIINTESIRNELGGYASRDEFNEKMGELYTESICKQLWDCPQINWDGKVLGCCINKSIDFGGNVFEDGLLKCLNSENIKYARLMLLGKKEPKEGIPCSECKNYRKLIDNGRIIKRGNLLSKFIKKVLGKYKYRIIL